MHTCDRQMKLRVRCLQKKHGHARPRLHWCPTGPFAFLPLHAAGNAEQKETGCSDYFVSSYTPTITSLLSTRQDLPIVQYSQATSLLVAAPSSLGVPVLHCAVEEITLAASILAPKTSNIVLGTDNSADGLAHIDIVVDKLREASLVHLACHGQQDLKNPLESGFRLSGGDRLTVSKLMQLNLKKAFFAFLSACETAKGDSTHSDQAIHLAAAMLFVGFRSVIATMW